MQADTTRIPWPLRTRQTEKSTQRSSSASLDRNMEKHRCIMIWLPMYRTVPVISIVRLGDERAWFLELRATVVILFICVAIWRTSADRWIFYDNVLLVEGDLFWIFSRLSGRDSLVLIPERTWQGRGYHVPPWRGFCYCYRFGFQGFRSGGAVVKSFTMNQKLGVKLVVNYTYNREGSVEVIITAVTLSVTKTIALEL